jgi:hypothetical protein
MKKRGEEFSKPQNSQRTGKSLCRAPAQLSCQLEGMGKKEQTHNFFAPSPRLTAKTASVISKNTTSKEKPFLLRNLCQRKDLQLKIQRFFFACTKTGVKKLRAQLPGRPPLEARSGSDLVVEKRAVYVGRSRAISERQTQAPRTQKKEAKTEAFAPPAYWHCGSRMQG